MPAELIIMIVLIIVIGLLGIAADRKHARIVREQMSASTPTAPPPAVVNMPEQTGKARGRAARRMSRGTGPMGRKF